MDSIAGFILAGGASSRMGTDKSRLLLQGSTMTERIAAAISHVTCSVVLVGGDAQDLGLQSARDVYERWGALGGIHAALSACYAEWALISACDLPFVSPALFTRLLSLREGFEAVVPIQLDGFRQPLCALYRVSPCLERSRALIESGERRPVALLDSINTRWVHFDELSDLSGSERFFDNINTPEDYLRATDETRQLPD
jgi:molybdopterin-guanine dinucleotide biosynthesis protein A